MRCCVCYQAQRGADNMPTTDSDSPEPLVSTLLTLVKKAVPKAATVEKYGGVLFTLHPEHKESQFCGVFQYATHAQLSFARGAQLDDPDGLLEGKGKARRHVNVSTAKDIKKAALTRLIKAAARG